MHDTPMLRGIQRLSDAWLAAAADPSRRLLVWRLPANAREDQGKPPSVNLHRGPGGSEAQR